MTDAEQGQRHRFAGIPNWISAGAAVVAAIGGIAFGFASLGSSDSSSPPTTTQSSASATVSSDEDEATLSPPRIITVRQDPPPIVSATGTAANLPSGSRIYLGVRTVPPVESATSEGPGLASGDETSAWQLSKSGSSVDESGGWTVEEFGIPESVDEPYEFFAVATTLGIVGAISNNLGSAPARRCPSRTERVAGLSLSSRCAVAKSTTVRYPSG